MQNLVKTRLFGVVAAAVMVLSALAATGCGGDDSKDSGGADLTGEISIDGSSTVYPFTQAAAESFGAENRGVNVTVGTSGTGGGFEKFCVGETAISNASRPIKDDDEAPICKKNGVEYIELQVASDGIAIVSNPDLKVDCLTIQQIKQVWDKGSKISSLSQVDPKLPATKLSLYGAGTDSGTFDFFTKEINGEEGQTRSDYQPSEDDNTLVQGVEGDKGGFGYFGFSYYEQNKDKLNLVGVDGGEGCIKPTKENIQSGEYAPLGRPIYMYASKEALRQPEVRQFLDYTLKNYEQIATDSQIVPMSADDAEASKNTLQGS